MQTGPGASGLAVVAELQRDAEVLFLEERITDWSSSRDGDEMRSWSAWIAACTFLSLRSLRNFTMARLASVGMPCCSVMTRCTVSLAPRSISPSLRFFTGTWRLIIRPCTISQSAFILNSSSATSVMVLSARLNSMIGFRALEVVALHDFLARLVERVVDLLQVDGRRHIERTRGCHRITPYFAAVSMISTRPSGLTSPVPDDRAGGSDRRFFAANTFTTSAAVGHVGHVDDRRRSRCDHRSRPAVIVRSRRVSVSAVCPAAFDALPGCTPSMPDRNTCGPTRMAELRFGFGLPGEPSAAGVVEGGAPGPFTATIVISIGSPADTSGVMTVARAGGSTGKAGPVHVVHRARTTRHPSGTPSRDTTSARDRSCGLQDGVCVLEHGVRLRLDVALHETVVGAPARDEPRQEQRVAGPHRVAQRSRRRGPPLRLHDHSVARRGPPRRPTPDARARHRQPRDDRRPSPAARRARYLAQTAFSAAKSPASARYTDVETTRSRDVPSVESLVRSASSTWAACAAKPAGSRRGRAGCPTRRRGRRARTTGAKGGGAWRGGA